MNTQGRILVVMASAFALPIGAAPLQAQVLHVNHHWDECAIVIDPALTQASWHQFVKEVGLVTYFRPLASARPLGRGSFELGLLEWGNRIDPATDAWNDTFSHPDATHWLFEGDALLIPGLMVRAGLTDRIDVGAYYTKALGANYGFFGGQLQYSFLNDTERSLGVAGRISAVRLYGPEDLEASTYGLDVVASKDISRFSPYIGVATYLSRGHETTDKVDLEDENVVGVQATVGVAVRLWALRLGAEAHLAEVTGYSFKVAFGT
jgi:hypothetical protein